MWCPYSIIISNNGFMWGRDKTIGWPYQHEGWATLFWPIYKYNQIDLLRKHIKWTLLLQLLITI